MDEPEIPKILIEFSGPNSTLFTPHLSGVIDPGMLLTIAAYFELVAKRRWNNAMFALEADQARVREQQSIAVPENTIVKPQAKILLKED